MQGRAQTPQSSATAATQWRGARAWLAQAQEALRAEFGVREASTAEARRWLALRKGVAAPSPRHPALRSSPSTRRRGPRRRRCLLSGAHCGRRRGRCARTPSGWAAGGGVRRGAATTRWNESLHLMRLWSARATWRWRLMRQSRERRTCEARWGKGTTLARPVSYTHLTLPTIYSV